MGGIEIGQVTCIQEKGRSQDFREGPPPPSLLRVRVREGVPDVHQGPEKDSKSYVHENFIFYETYVCQNRKWETTEMGLGRTEKVWEVSERVPEGFSKGWEGIPAGMEGI